MTKIHRKLVYALPGNPAPWSPQQAGTPPVPPPEASDTSALSEEFLGWARWLDSLRDAAKGGSHDAVQALAKGKLRFILRRSSLLRDKTMLGNLQAAQLNEALALTQEFEQVVGELTGRIMPAADEWPLPMRFYLPQPATRAAAGLHHPQERRRQGIERQNRLDAVTQAEAQQIYGCLRLVLRLLQQQINLAESPAMQQASSILASTHRLGHLDHQ
jgi:hypothetical protein